MDYKLPVAQDPLDENVRRMEIKEALHTQAVSGNIVAVAAIERLAAEDRYRNFIKGMDDDEDVFTPLQN